MTFVPTSHLPIHSFLLAFFIYFFDLFHSCSCHAQVLGTTLVHEFHIPCSHIEWNLLASLCDNSDKFRNLSGGISNHLMWGHTVLPYRPRWSRYTQQRWMIDRPMISWPVPSKMNSVRPTLSYACK